GGARRGRGARLGGARRAARGGRPGPRPPRPAAAAVRSRRSGAAFDRRGSAVTRIRPVLVVFARTFLRKLGLVAGRRARSTQLIDSTYDFDLLRRRCGRGK